MRVRMAWPVDGVNLADLTRSAIIFTVFAICTAVGGIGFLAVEPAAADGEVVLETMANGAPADTAPGPTVRSGETVNVRYVITVGSNEPLYDFIVINETGDGNPNCDADGDGKVDDTNGHPGPLSNGDSFFCVASIVAGAPGLTYSTVGRVKAFDFDLEQSFVHQDAAHYTTARTTTTAAPTTAASTTAAPTTAAPTTAAPTTAAPTTAAPNSASTSSPSSASNSSSTITPSLSIESATSSSPPPSLATTGDELALPPSEGAADRDLDDSDTANGDTDAGDVDDVTVDKLSFDDGAAGPPWGWLLLAFAAGAAVTAAVTVRTQGENATVPDQ